MEAFSSFQTSPSLSHSPFKSNPSSPNSRITSPSNTFQRINLGFQCKQFDRRTDLRRKNHVFPIEDVCLRLRNGFQGIGSLDSLTGFPLGSRYRLSPLLQKQYSECRNIVARSELIGTGSPNTEYPLTEFQLGSKLRGIGFYTVTAVAAIFLFVVMLALHPFVLLVDRYRRKAHYAVAKIWASLTIYPFIDVKVEGLKNLPPADNPAVYVSNHQSFLDIYTLLTLGRSFKFISKTGIFVIPIIGWAMFLMGVIPLRRMDSRSQLDCLKRCMDLVKKGASVFFFPEGTRSKDGKLGPFKKGAFSVAAKARVAVVPITLVGTGKLMPPGMEATLNMGSIKVVINKPIEGSNPELLRDEAWNAIADDLVRHGHGVRRVE
ncbi:1-acyl-sn-glycerol-3-phosphate acyltransferase 1, chloroplastic-like protein isoform X1 [Cinnamomum micranthum f. kanehirae]|uniref:1-acyl-sn-glycerol-3-phosphate acyltransferase n=1 Tax=Cinnamomum micranthum f. kanehirae TaxID=337451 RepID=A0A3S3QYC4_9MAGN|nr:1-acyl-sn-glycerol-3-phosphate acyltransferase 1, chloroplastic-like protein isoform X1 [Cinnamomum micranthum f. kanehirae]